MTTRRLKAPVLALSGLLALTSTALAQDTNATKPPPVPPPAAAAADPGAPTPPPLPPAVTPPPLPPEPAYWIEEGGAQGGPYKMAELEARVADGTLRPGTLAWAEGMAAWTPASAVEDLAPLFAAAPAPPPPDPAPEPAADATDPAAFVVGSWRQQGQMPIDGGGTGMADLTAEFLADGTFTIEGGIQTSVNGQPQQIGVSAKGKYTVRAGQGTQLMVSYDGMMDVDMGFGPMSTPLTDSSIYERVDANTLRDLGTGETLTRIP